MKITSLNINNIKSQPTPTLVELSKSLSKLNDMLLPLADKNVKNADDEYKNAKKELILTLNQTKKQKAKFADLKFQRLKLTETSKLLNLIESLITKINMGKVTLKNIQKDLKDLGNLSLQDIKNKIKLYEDVRDKYLYL